MFKFKRKAMKVTSEIRDTTIAETLALLTLARREMIWFEIENEGQQRTRDYLVEQMGILLGELRKEYHGLD